MNYEEMLTWLLFYTSIFQARKTPMVDVVDPAGLVRSQAIENDDGALRLTLNGAENQQDARRPLHRRELRLGRAARRLPHRRHVRDRRGAQGQRFQAAARSRPTTTTIWRRASVSSRISLDRLRADNVLYDRDDRGEFFQLYSPNYGDGFFFEIVERRNGYAGYGAPNALFRIAAQRRSLPPKGMPRR